TVQVMMVTTTGTSMS
nr:immunoglobulin heavy chain junction region [Mus musculus]